MCRKVKLPRKRKKAYIKAKSRTDYLGLQILSELLCEQGVKHANRFYQFREVKNDKEYKRPDYKNGYVIEKRW